MNKRKRLRLKPIPKIIIYILSFIIFFCFCETRVKLLPTEYLQINANEFAQNAINKVIEKKFSDIDTAYNILYDETDLSILEANASEINSLKSDLVVEINKSLNGNNFTFIPIGNLLSYTLLNGYGFKIPVNMYYVGSCEVTLVSEFESSGINQTRYSLTAVIDANVCTASLTNNATSSASVEYLLCEIVFVGEVPNYKTIF
ncbi:MAG: sporulation protein YunB [Clostridia bacterium]